MDSLNQIKDTAAHWLARRGREEWSEADEAQLQTWLDQRTSHRVAFLRLESTWKQADRLKVLGAGFPAGKVPTLDDFRASPFFKHVAPGVGQDTAPIKPRARAWQWALAATVLLTAGVVTTYQIFFSGQAYSTPVGGIAQVPMTDGSRVVLNTDSKVKLTVTDTERRVELTRGEIFLDVVKDPTRPFIVIAGDKRIVAVGTRFSVRRADDSDVRIVVTEGAVRLEGVPADAAPQSPSAVSDAAPHNPSQNSSRESRSTRPLLLTAGAVAQAEESGVTVETRTAPQAEELLSWRSGYVVFHETSLADAVAEFNRYNERKFVLEAGPVGEIRISGNFSATNMDSFAQLLEDGFPVVVQRGSGKIVLTEKPQG